MLPFIPLIPLFALSLPPSVSSLTCRRNQYVWPPKSQSLCCDKCAPGQRMRRRSETTCWIQCEACTPDLYTDKHNTEMSCSVCRRCDKPNMEYESECSSTRDAVCRCKHGHTCKDSSCSWCTAPDERPKRHTLTTATTRRLEGFPTKLSATSTITASVSPPKETRWRVGIILLFCMGITMFISIQIQPFLHWLKSRCRRPTPGRPGVQRPVEDDDVSVPIQEMGDESKICTSILLSDRIRFT